MGTFRIGHGYDVHRLQSGRRLVLGGVDIPFSMGLAGHSDADVLVHAVCDSLLGALALGDIGRHFPDTDSAFKDADSLVLLRSCVQMMRDQGWMLGNLDATLIAQEPKLAPYIPQMQSNIAEVFGAQAGQVNIKATTEEHLGFTGALQGIRAHCVLLITESISGSTV